MSASESITPLLGRFLLAWFFLSQAVQRIREWDAMVVLTQMKHLPFGPLLLALAVLAMIWGGFMLILGYQTRFAALMLSFCTAVWIYVAHDFWTLRDPILRGADYLTFSLGVALIGGLLALTGLGGGRFSLDHLRHARRIQSNS